MSNAADLSPTMRDALRKIVAEYDAAVADSTTRWGAACGAYRAEHGIDPCLLVKGYRTIHALSDRGLLTFTAHRGTHSTTRRGSWGKRLGGTTTHSYTQLMVVPTDAGRAALA